MTDDAQVEGRIDLRALGLEHEPSQIDAAVRATLHELHQTTMLVRAQRTLLAIAAALVVIAAATVLNSSPRRGVESDRDVLAQWTDAGYVPTNGELLAAYQGYRP